MYLNAVKYADAWLAPGSEAYTLFKEKKFDELKKLMAACSAAKDKLEGKKG
jgi:hypothetical protein